MKSSNATFGGTPSNREQRPPSASESQTRVSAHGATQSGALLERGRWASCDGNEPRPEVSAAQPRRVEPVKAQAPRQQPRRVEPANAEEPRTGVVRRVDFSTGERAARERASGVLSRGVPQTPPPSERRAQQPSAQQPSQQQAVGPRAHESSAGASGGWGCLEWGRPAKERRAKRNSKVTIVQLSRIGDLVRQNGPDAWLPEAGDFMHRMAGLLAQGLGFEECRSVCLKSSSAVLSVAEAGTNVVAVSGPVGSMTNVLRRAGLE